MTEDDRPYIFDRERAEHLARAEDAALMAAAMWRTEPETGIPYLAVPEDKAIAACLQSIAHSLLVIAANTYPRGWTR